MADALSGPPVARRPAAPRRRARSRRALPLLAALAAACGRTTPDEPAARAQPAPRPAASPAPGAPASAAPSPLVGSPAPDAAGLRRMVAEEKAMGTLVSIQAFAPDDGALPAPARETLAAALAEIHRIEGLMSTWVESSEVWAINAHGFERPVAVGPETLAVLERSRWASERSDGVFDITFEAMRGLWRFDHDLDGRVPDARDVAARRAFVDYRDVLLDGPRRQVRLRRPETRINLGGIAKGYAVDRAAQRLLAGGLTSFLVQAGGDLYVHGRKPDGSPWVVGVRDPRGPEGSFFGALAVEDHAFSTAGDYERSFLRDGRRYHHILDPRTGYPATACRGVTVWAPDAFTADAIDDAIFILGPERGLALCEETPGCGAVIVDAANKVWVSSRLTSLFHQHRPPSEGT